MVVTGGPTDKNEFYGPFKSVHEAQLFIEALSKKVADTMNVTMIHKPGKLSGPHCQKCEKELELKDFTYRGCTNCAAVLPENARW
jgi:hypothetical protein